MLECGCGSTYRLRNRPWDHTRSIHPFPYLRSIPLFHTPVPYLRWSMLDSWGPCWVHVGPMLDYLVGYMGFHGSLLGCKKISQPKTFRLGCFFWPFRGLCGANVGPYGVHVGPMLCHMGFMLGPCWVLWSHVGAMLSLCWAKNGVVLLASKQGQKEHAFLGACWGHVGPMLGDMGSMLGPCWTLWSHVGAMLSLCWAYVGPRTACSFCICIYSWYMFLDWLMLLDLTVIDRDFDMFTTIKRWGYNIADKWRLAIVDD